MTDSDKLIELLKKADENASRKLIMDYNDAIADNADYLLANGVILKPCEIGTKVWCIWQPHELWIDDDLFINEAVVIGFTVDENKTKVITSDYFH